MTNEFLIKQIIGINAVIEDINIQREKVLNKCLPTKEDSETMKIVKEGYLEEVPSFKVTVEHLGIYDDFFEKYIKLNQKLISCLEGKMIKEEDEKEVKEKTEEDKYVEEEGEDDEWWLWKRKIIN